MVEGGMFGVEYGSLLVAFTGAKVCGRCNNHTPFQVRVNYQSASILGFTLANVGINANQLFGAVSRVCPVCKATVQIMHADYMSRRLQKADAWSRLHALLDEGKDYTKAWISTLSPKDRAAALKRLNTLKAHDLVVYLET
jgi:hypothetical protein